MEKSDKSNRQKRASDGQMQGDKRRPEISAGLTRVQKHLTSQSLTWLTLTTCQEEPWLWFLTYANVLAWLRWSDRWVGR